MRTTRNSIGSLAIIGGLIGSLNFVQAAGTIKPVQSVSADDMAVMLQAVEQTTPTEAESVPRYGTFYSALHANWAPLPANVNNVPAWNLGDGVWLLDDLDQPQAQMQTMAGNMMAMDAPLPGDGGDGGTNSYSANESSFVLPDYGTNLWIAQAGIASGNLVGIISNTISGIYFELQSKSDLIYDTQWVSSGFGVYGSELTNWTPFSVAAVSSTNNLFLRIRSWADSTGSGIPDWWWLQYFGSVGGDPFAFDSAGDGWTLWQDFVEGLNPTVFKTPPAPQGLTVAYNANNGTAIVSWQPAPGAVTGYTVQVSDGNTFNFSPSVTSFTDDVSTDGPYDFANAGPTIGTTFQVQAQYGASGNSAWSDPVPLEQNTLSASIIPGPQGLAYLVVAVMPPNTAAIRLTRDDYRAEDDNESYGLGEIPNNTNFDIPIINFTNGICILPNNITPPDVQGYSLYNWYGQAVGANGDGLSAATILSGGITSPVDNNSWLAIPYFDGRQQLKQNLIFQLRAAVADQPFQFTEIFTNCSGCQFPFASPSTYAYAGYYYFYEYYNDSGVAYEPIFNVFLPFEENYFDRNFVFDSSLLDANGRSTTGVGGQYYNYGSGGLTIQGGAPVYFSDYFQLLAAYHFVAPTINGVTIAPLLATNQTRWLATYPLDSSYYYLPKIGVTNEYYPPPTIYAMFNNARNLFGLPFLTTAIGYGSGLAITLSAGGGTTQGGYFYPETAQPKFRLVEYDWWMAPNAWYDVFTNGTDFPGMAGLSLTHANPILITSVGNPYFSIAGYAKLEVTNSYYTGVYGYLGQYFDQAYTKDTNGNVTTNKTGIVSPYGNFFATEPGPAALVTMPDVDTGARGTCTVYCVSIVLDKNHDLVMDKSFNGPDATSQASPMVFHVNNDCDWATTANDPGEDIEVLPVNPGFFWDYEYYQPRSIRDLEDYARLWICGVPTLTNGGYQVTMSWANVSGSPAVNLIQSADTNGGTLYLTDTNTAWRQLSSAFSQKYRVPTTGTLTLPGNWFTNASNKYFLFEGAGIGSGELVMTISQNGNTIAQTGVWLDLHDVKDFYEQAVITNNISGSISNWTSGVEIVQPAIASALGDDTNLIVLVHGFNVGDLDWQLQSATVFKRLYWAGYHGKFMTVKWPCEPITLWNAISENTSIFNNSEIKSYKAGTALKNYLSQLRSRFPNYRLNVLAHSQGNAIMGEAIEQGAPFDTYILTQGAMPASSYDVNASTDSTLLTAEALVHTPEWKPMGYHGVYTNMTGKIVSYYNPNDSVLGIWKLDQSAGKPDSYANHVLFPLAPYYSYDGANGWWNGILYGLFSSYLVTDPQESRAMISRSRTGPVGRQDTGGVINSTVNLSTQFGFTTGTAEHSAEWTRPIQTSRPYYVQILNSIVP